MSAWISVKERLPDDSLVLALFPPNCIRTASYYDDIGWSHDLDDPDAIPTHWQPLPEPPESGE